MINAKFVLRWISSTAFAPTLTNITLHLFQRVLCGLWYLMPLSYIVAVSLICGGNGNSQRKPLTCSKSLTNFITKGCIEYNSSWTRFKLTLVVIGTDCTGSCKSNYHTITTTIAPLFQRKKILQIYKFTKIVIFNVDCKLFSNYVNPFDIFKERTITRENNFSNTPLIILYSPHIPLSSVPLKHDTVPSHTSCSGIHSPDEHL